MKSKRLSNCEVLIGVSYFPTELYFIPQLNFQVAFTFISMQVLHGKMLLYEKCAMREGTCPKGVKRGVVESLGEKDFLMVWPQ